MRSSSARNAFGHDIPPDTIGRRAISALTPIASPTESLRNPRTYPACEWLCPHTRHAPPTTQHDHQVLLLVPYTRALHLHCTDSRNLVELSPICATLTRYPQGPRATAARSPKTTTNTRIWLSIYRQHIPRTNPSRLKRIHG